jgi:molecular chaperone GrpE
VSKRERRALADYQNLLRQSQQQRANLVRLANADLLLNILEPLEHLATASQQLQDQGLEMIINQLWKRLQENGLEEIEVLNKKFDVDTMEVVEKKIREKR